MTGSNLALPPGVYTPLATFFDENEDLDLQSYKTHVLHIVKQGAIPVCAGSLGEAVHLDRDDRKAIVALTRECLDEAGFQDTPIVAGVGGTSLRETLLLARDAAAAGATVGMVIPPAYYAATLNQDESQIEQYYVDICQESPIPILLYNFPANSAGQDLNADLLARVLHRAPNLAGMKLTCDGRIDKLRRLKSDCSKSPDRKDFLILDGVVHDLPEWVCIGGHGTVSGVSNMAPATTVRLLRLCQKSSRTSAEEEEIETIRDMLARFDAVAMPLGVRGLKYALSKLHNYSPVARRPLSLLPEAKGEPFATLLPELMTFEKKYEKT